MGAAGKLRDRLRPHYSRLRFAYVPIHRHISFRLGTHTLRAFSAAGRATNAVAKNDFDAFLIRATPEARLSIFRQRPFQSLSNNPWFGFDPLSPAGYEPELAHLLDYLVPDTGVFLDVGSNRGYFSIYLATRPKFHGRIHAFEPVSATFSILQDNINKLHCEKIVSCHKLAASDENGTAKMEVHHADSGLNRINDDHKGGETVDKITLDSLNFRKVDFIKMDVEGHERQALQGARKLIDATQPFIFFESWSSAAQPDKAFEPLQFLVDCGYQLFLPAWLQPDGTFVVGLGPFERNIFGLVPFNVEDRATFPNFPFGNPMNLFACPASRQHSLGYYRPGVLRRMLLMSRAYSHVFGYPSVDDVPVDRP